MITTHDIALAIACMNGKGGGTDQHLPTAHRIAAWLGTYGYNYGLGDFDTITHYLAEHYHLKTTTTPYEPLLRSHPRLPGSSKLRRKDIA